MLANGRNCPSTSIHLPIWCQSVSNQFVIDIIYTYQKHHYHNNVVQVDNFALIYLHVSLTFSLILLETWEQETRVYFLSYRYLLQIILAN